MILFGFHLKLRNVNKYPPTRPAKRKDTKRPACDLSAQFLPNKNKNNNKSLFFLQWLQSPMLISSPSIPVFSRLVKCGHDFVSKFSLSLLFRRFLGDDFKVRKQYGKVSSRLARDETQICETSLARLRCESLAKIFCPYLSQN